MSSISRRAKLIVAALILGAALQISGPLHAQVDCTVIDNCHYCVFDGGAHGFLIWCKPAN
jgi:hypothetical protein